MSKLNFLNGWAGASNYFSRRSAQSFMGSQQMAFATAGCGSSCGSGDEAPKPASACGAGDDDKQNPPASACGAGDDAPKPASACGAGDGK